MQFGRSRNAHLVCQGPIDHPQGVVFLGIVGVAFDGTSVVLLGIVKFLHVEVQRGDSLDCVRCRRGIRVKVQDALVLFNRLLAHADVLLRLCARDVLLSESCGQVEMRHDKTRLQRRGVLKMFDRFVEPRLPVRLHPQIKLITGRDWLLPRRRQTRKQEHYRKQNSRSAHLGAPLEQSCGEHIAIRHHDRRNWSAKVPHIGTSRCRVFLLLKHLPIPHPPCVEAQSPSPLGRHLCEPSASALGLAKEKSSEPGGRRLPAARLC